MRSRRYAELKRLKARRYALRRRLMSLTGNPDGASRVDNGERELTERPPKETTHDKPAP